MGKTPHRVAFSVSVPGMAQPGLTWAGSKNDVFWPCFLPHGADCEGQSWTGSQQRKGHSWCEAKESFLSRGMPTPGEAKQTFLSRGMPTPRVKPPDFPELSGCARAAAQTPAGAGWSSELCWCSIMPVCIHTSIPHACAVLSHCFRLQETAETWPTEHTEFRITPALKRFEFQYSVWRQASHFYNHCTAGAFLGIPLGSRAMLFACSCSTTKFCFSPQWKAALMPILAAWIGILNANWISHLCNWDNSTH